MQTLIAPATVHLHRLRDRSPKPSDYSPDGMAWVLIAGDCTEAEAEWALDDPTRWGEDVFWLPYSALPSVSDPLPSDLPPAWFQGRGWRFRGFVDDGEAVGGWLLEDLEAALPGVPYYPSPAESVEGWRMVAHPGAVLLPEALPLPPADVLRLYNPEPAFYDL
jgi:hypothetical protein